MLLVVYFPVSVGEGKRATDLWSRGHARSPWRLPQHPSLGSLLAAKTTTIAAATAATSARPVRPISILNPTKRLLRSSFPPLHCCRVRNPTRISWYLLFLSSTFFFFIIIILVFFFSFKEMNDQKLYATNLDLRI